MDDVMKLDFRSERDDLERVSHKLNNDTARAQGGGSQGAETFPPHKLPRHCETANPWHPRSALTRSLDFGQLEKSGSCLDCDLCTATAIGFRLKVRSDVFAVSLVITVVMRLVAEM